MNLENETAIQNNNKRYNIPRYDARMAQLEAYYKRSMHYESHQLAPARVCDRARRKAMDRERIERERTEQMETIDMKPSAVMRVMAKKDQRHTLFEKCQITELKGVCRHAALLLEIHESGGEKKLIDCKYNGRNDSQKLVDLELIEKRDTACMAHNHKPLKELVLTETGKQKAEYASNVLQNIINRIQTKQVTL